MFGLFKNKSQLEKLQHSYKTLLERAYKISHTDRAASDRMMAEAEEMAKKIDKLNAGK